MSRHSIRIGLTIITVFLMHIVSPAWSASQTVLRFDQLYEPSGVVQSRDGRILLIDDEERFPLFLSSIIEDKSNNLILKPTPSKHFDIDIDDLEGIARGKERDIFLITSHSATKKGNRREARERLAKVAVKNSMINGIEVAGSLLPSIRSHLERNTALDPKNLERINIEGIAFDSAKETLLIGFREPLIDQKSIILQLKNPYGVIKSKEDPVYHDEIILLDLQGAGIRALSYADQLDLYILSGEVSHDGGKKLSWVWTWDGDTASPPRRLNLQELAGVRNIEGITVIERRKTTFLLFVCDSGQRSKKKGGTYRLITIGNHLYPAP